MAEDEGQSAADTAPEADDQDCALEDCSDPLRAVSSVGVTESDGCNVGAAPVALRNQFDEFAILRRKSLEPLCGQPVGLGFGGLLPYDDPPRGKGKGAEGERGRGHVTSAVSPEHRGVVIQRRHMVSVHDVKEKRSGEVASSGQDVRESSRDKEEAVSSETEQFDPDHRGAIETADQGSAGETVEAGPGEGATICVADAHALPQGEPGSTEYSTASNPRKGEGENLVASSLLQDRLRGWIGSTGPLARDITVAAVAKASISLPVTVKSWWATSPSGKKEAANASLQPPQANSSQNNKASESTFGGLLSKGANLVLRPSSLTVPAESLPSDNYAPPSQVLQPVGGEPAEKAEESGRLIAELKQSLKSVLGEAVKCDREPMGDGIYALTLFCSLVEQALGHGLKGSSRGRWSFWGAGKMQVSFFNLLEAMEHSVPANQSFRGALGLDAVRSLTWVKSSVGQLRAWLRLSLNEGLLGRRLSIILEDPDLLEQWYKSWALLRREDASEEFASIVTALDSVNISLSVSEGLALDHQKFIGAKALHLTQVVEPEQAPPDSTWQEALHYEPKSSDSHSLDPEGTDELQNTRGEMGALSEKKPRGNSKSGAKKRVISVPDGGANDEQVDGRIGFNGYKVYTGPPDEEVLVNGMTEVIAQSPPLEGVSTQCESEGALQIFHPQQQGQQKTLTEQVEESYGTPDAKDEVPAVRPQVTSRGGQYSPSLHSGGAPEDIYVLTDDAATTGRDRSFKDACASFHLETGLPRLGLPPDVDDSNIHGVLSDANFESEDVLQSASFVDNLLSKPRSGSAFAALEHCLTTEHLSEQIDADCQEKKVLEVAPFCCTSPASEQGYGSDNDSDTSMFEVAGELSEKQKRNVPYFRNRRMATAFDLCKKYDDELAFGASDWDEYFQQPDPLGDFSSDPTTIETSLSKRFLGLNSSPLQIPSSDAQTERTVDAWQEDAAPVHVGPREPLGGHGTGWPYHDYEEAEPETKDVIQLKGVMAGDLALADANWQVAEVPSFETEVSHIRPVEVSGQSIPRQAEDPLGCAVSMISGNADSISNSDGTGSQDDQDEQLGGELGGYRQKVAPLKAKQPESTLLSICSANQPEDVSAKVRGPSNVFAGPASLEGFEPQVSRPLEEGNKRRGCVARLGSKEAEELLQLDVAKLGRASFQSMKEATQVQNSPSLVSPWSSEDLGPDELSRYVEKVEVKETYIDTVLDMENVLLTEDSRMFEDMGSSRAIRDGSLYASTSGFLSLGRGRPVVRKGKEVVWVEVIGARQQRGGASLGERIVGVQEHTVYRMLVTGVNSEWEVERRYRDFVVLHNQLANLFPPQNGFFLPAPWDKVKAESRKFFGNTSPNVVEVRSALIQVCLQSLIQAGTPFKNAAPLLEFLAPHDDASWPPAAPGSVAGSSASHLPLEDFVTNYSSSPRSDSTSIVGDQDQDAKGSAVFGSTIRLIVQVHAEKSLKRQLHAQHNACAGCYEHLVLATGVVPGFVQRLGLAGPRLCEYSGQLFCPSCHSNDVSIIPAQVLQRWNFSARKVSQLAKAYLDSIYEQPMLCVSAVNPYLYGKVPILGNLRDMRRKLSRMMACVHCPARGRILAMLGSRRYLAENNDFFALRDLADISKGAFAVVPGIMKTVCERAYIHITRECSVCYETGEACGAGEWCDDFFDTIFPFQDDNIKRCPCCKVPFHKSCFKNCSDCPSCHGQKPADAASTSGYSTEDSTQERRSRSSRRTPSELPFTPFEGGESSSNSNSQKRRRGKSYLGRVLGGNEGKTDRSLKGSRSNSAVLNMSSLPGPLEL